MKKNWFPFLMIGLSLLVGLFFYDKLPEQVATHWGVDGEPDGYSSKWWGAFFAPALMVSFLMLKIYLPKFDPKKENYEKFQKSYSITMDITFAFFFVLHIAMLLFNTGYNINITFVISFLMGILFIVLGNYMPKFKHNYFVGIKTSWALANEEVWRKTHRFGGKMYILTGVAIIFLLFLGFHEAFVILCPVLISTLLIFLKSYLYFKEEKKED